MENGPVSMATFVAHGQRRRQLRTLGDKGGVTQLLTEHAGQGAPAAAQIRAVDYRA
jgi:hypothetical protein